MIGSHLIREEGTERKAQRGMHGTTGVRAANRLFERVLGAELFRSGAGIDDKQAGSDWLRRGRVADRMPEPLTLRILAGGSSPHHTRSFRK
jgi:hypothetical protein